MKVSSSKDQKFMPYSKRLFINKNLMWFLLISLIARVTILNRVRDVGAYSRLDASALVEIIIIGLCFISLMIWPEFKVNFQKFLRKPLFILLLYYLFCLSSSIWSRNPVFTLYRSFEIIVLIIFIYNLLASYEDFDLKEKVTIKSLLLFLCLFLIMYLKDNGLSRGISGFHTNAYTVFSGAGFVYCLGEFFSASGKRKNFLLWSLPFLLAGLLIGTSLASNVATICGLSIIFIFQKKYRRYLVVIVVIVGIYLFLLDDAKSFFYDFFLGGRSEQQLSTLTGRKVLWDAYFRMIKTNPLIGNGFAVGARIASGFGGISTTNTHNGFLEVILGTGIIGCLIFGLWLIKTFFKLVRNQLVNRKGSTGFLAAFTMIMVNNLSISIIGGAFHSTLITTLLLISFFESEINENKDMDRKDSVIMPKIKIRW
jgi:O-antigen ligase